MKKNYKDITVILTLYKTPINKLNNLLNYKNYKILILDQGENISTKMYLKNKLNLDIKYFSSKENIGLARSSNFLLSKVKTKYCLFTQPDISICGKSIKILKNIMIKKKDLILITPNHSKKLKKRIDYKIEKKINFSCVLFDVKKIKKIGFFDEDFFLYWEDIFLERKINASKFKMAVANKAKVKHSISQSSKKSYKTDYIRRLNFMYGELVFDFKLKKLRLLKVLRKLIQNIFLFVFNILFFQLKEAIGNVAKINGLFKFINFFIKKY